MAYSPSLIESVNALFDEFMLTTKQRQAGARFIILSFCKLDTAAQLKRKLLRPLFTTKADDVTLSLLYGWQRKQQSSIEYSMMLWRGLFCYVHTDSCEHAANISGFSQSDIRYAIGCLSQEDIRRIRKNKELNWQRAPISESAKQKVIEAVMPHINRCSYKLDYQTERRNTGDLSVSRIDIVQHLIVHALTVIAHYECTRRGEHLIRTVATSITNSQRDLCDTFGAAKRCASPSRLEVVDSKTGKKEWLSTVLVEPITLKQDDGSDMENPALAKRAIDISESIEVRDIIELVRAHNPKVGRYLDLAVADKRSKKFHKWLRLRKRKITTTDLLESQARRFCGVSCSDMADVRLLVAREYGIENFAELLAETGNTPDCC
jgi:hypothetical protein